MHRRQKAKPVVKSISFDAPAQMLANAPASLEKPLKKSIPPIKIIKPSKTAICIISFFFCGAFKAMTPHAHIGTPSKDGMNEVMEELALKRLTIIPHRIKNSP